MLIVWIVDDLRVAQEKSLADYTIEDLFLLVAHTERWPVYTVMDTHPERPPRLHYMWRGAILEERHRAELEWLARRAGAIQ